MTVTLDIVMPFYGRVDHFELAVTSVLAQTNGDWRLVVLDDHYPDEAPGRWLVRLGDPRIQYVRHPANIGINRNFQAAMDAAQNERFVIFGCDDVMLPRYVQRVAELASLHPAAAMIHPGTEVIDADGRAVRTLVDTIKAFYKPRFSGTTELQGQALAVSITRGNWMNFPAIAWRRDITVRAGFRPGFDVVQDLALALDVAFDGGTLILDDEVVFQYRRHSGSVSSWQAVEGRRFAEEHRFFTQLAAEFTARGWPRAQSAARLHLSSRLHALTRLPAAITSRQRASIIALARHALGA